MKSITKQKAVLAAAMILAAVLSFAVLAAASAAASAGITLIPGDVATPIADKLADLSSAFLVVLCAIYLEKYLVTMTFYVAFRYLVPAVCLLLVINLFWQRDWLQRLMVKLVAFTVVICAVVAVRAIWPHHPEHHPSAEEGAASQPADLSGKDAPKPQEQPLEKEERAHE